MQNDVVHEDWWQMVDQSNKKKRDIEETDKEEGRKKRDIYLNAEQRGPQGLAANR